jgi:hypothetical protein
MTELRADLCFGTQPPAQVGLEDHVEQPVWQAAISLMAHPAFRRSVLDYCRRMVEPSGFRWPANKIFAQKMRYITCYILIGLAGRFERGAGPAPTITLLQALVPGSARQVSDLMAGLKAGGFVIAEQDARDRRSIHLRPTAPLVLEIGRSPLAFLAASVLLEQPSWHEALTAAPLRLGDVLARSMDAFVAKDVLFEPFPTIVEFTGRDSGYLMLCAVIGAHLAGYMGDNWDLPLTYDALCQRFQVSRQHVGNVLGPSLKRGHFSIHSGRVETVDAALLTEFFWWSAGQMAHFQLVAHETGPV